MHKLDATDRKIIAHLQAEGRMSNAELSERINLSPSACLRRVNKLEEDGVIDGYAMLVNQAAIGKPSNIFVEITLNSQSEESLDAFEAAVMACGDVMECYLMSGDSDYLLRIAAADANDYEYIHRNYLSRLPGVARIRSNFTLRKIKNITAFPLA